MKLPKDVNCAEWQSQLSLYLYGELDFATEEALEEHLDGCPQIRMAEFLIRLEMSAFRPLVPGVYENVARPAYRVLLCESGSFGQPRGIMRRRTAMETCAGAAASRRVVPACHYRRDERKIVCTELALNKWQ